MPITFRAQLVCAVYAVLLFLAPVPALAGRPKEGDVLKIFQNQRVYVITNAEADAPALADLLLDGVPVKERRVLTLSEWNALPRETRWYVSCVYLVDRERLPMWSQVPSTCRAEPTETWQEVVRTGRDWGVAYDVTVSAPDRAQLERAVAAFRRLKEAPRQPVTEAVRSLAVVPVGDGAGRAAEPAVRSLNTARLAHTVAGRDYAFRQARLANMDELVLVDRSTANAAGLPTAFAPVADKLLADSGDAVAWREAKPGGYVRAYLSAPTGAMLSALLQKCENGNLLSLATFDKPTVLQSARDLRPVRRVAVASVGGENISTDASGNIAALAASELRQLDAFEVLERAALTTVLAEIALDQAGFTKGANRAKVRRLAAADALLIVDLGRTTGGTEYTCSAVRTTPKMTDPPRRPSEPSRLKGNIAWGDKDNGIVRVAVEGLLKGVVGTKTDAEYESAMREYRRQTVPAWERAVSEYNAAAETRRIEWAQTITARSTVHIAGSVRLVDLSDGLVLWEAPIAATDTQEKTRQTRTVCTTGETSAAPGADDLPGATGDIPTDLLTRTAEQSVAATLRSLPATALLPVASPLESAPSFSLAKGGGGIGGQTSGKVMDVDTDTVLVGLGAGDGVRVGDTLSWAGANGAALTLTVTRVRPRTCDATFAPGTTATNRARVQIGDAVNRAQTK